MSRDLADTLFPGHLPGPDEWETRYPARGLPAGAEVTRFAPSPTGALHIGGVYVATIARDVAHHSGGTYFVRIEDTDRSRLVPEAEAQFAEAFDAFGIAPDPDGLSAWGPARQSERADIYAAFAADLVGRDQAYPCFCSQADLAALAERQRAASVPTGYYGRWAKCRDLSDEDVLELLSAGRTYVIRFRAPGEYPGRVRYTDRIRGELDLEGNRNDAVILKSSAEAIRLPTYHFAHVIDDHLMRVTLVIRGDEWISSVPLHLQLAESLGFEPFQYAHIAPLMIQDGGSRRKLSKRKDATASVAYYLETGYPPEAVLYYLRGMANGRLAELPFAESFVEPIRLEECGSYGPLLDVAKLDHVSRNYVAALPGDELLARIIEWAQKYDPELVGVLTDDRVFARKVVDVERVDVPNPRKDLFRWADFRELYGFFFDALFTPTTDPKDERLGGLDATVVRDLTTYVVAHYRHDEDQVAWFAQIREAAAATGFAADPKTYKQNRDAYHGSIKEASRVVRVALTGSTRSPDLHAVAMALGADGVRRRLSSLSWAADAEASLS